VLPLSEQAPVVVPGAEGVEFVASAARFCHALEQSKELQTPEQRRSAGYRYDSLALDHPSLEREWIHYPSNNKCGSQKSYEYKYTVLNLLARCAFGDDGKYNRDQQSKHDECREMGLHLRLSAPGNVERVEHDQIIQ
jgi:hypothetical protein